MRRSFDGQGEQTVTDATAVLVLSCCHMQKGVQHTIVHTQKLERGFQQVRSVSAYLQTSATVPADLSNSICRLQQQYTIM